MHSSALSRSMVVVASRQHGTMMLMVYFSACTRYTHAYVS
jgi:hypothetical protein